MKLACVVGTRPQLIKVAAAWHALRRDHEPRLIDTGQHYDEEMAGRFFGELHLPAPDRQLGVGSGSRARQVAAIMDALEPVLLDERPDAVVVFGDTNSTLAGALVAAGLDLPLAHVEAGLRSFDRRMPEEINRVVVDHLAQLLLAPNAQATSNLTAEGIGGGLSDDAAGGSAGGSDDARAAGSSRGPDEDAAKRPGGGWRRPRVEVVGDLMQDLCAAAVPFVRDPASVGEGAPEEIAALHLRTGEYLFATVHRAENRPPEAIREWLALLGALGRPVVLALHPGTRRAIDESDCAVPPNVHAVPPQGYATTLALQLHAAAVVTDSGGVQREAGWLGTPALVLRGSTEWTGTLETQGGRSVLVGRDAARALDALARLAPAASSAGAAARRAAAATVAPAGADERVSAALGDWLGS